MSEPLVPRLGRGIFETAALPTPAPAPAPPGEGEAAAGVGRPLLRGDMATIFARQVFVFGSCFLFSKPISRRPCRLWHT